MTTTDTDALTERLEDALIGALHTERDEDGCVWVADGFVEPSDLSAAVLPIVAEEVRKAKAEALREAARGFFAMSPRITYSGRHVQGRLLSRADRYETGDSDEHR